MGLSNPKIANVEIDAVYEACPDGKDRLAWAIPLRLFPVPLIRFHSPNSSVPKHL